MWWERPLLGVWNLGPGSDPALSLISHLIIMGLQMIISALDGFFANEGMDLISDIKDSLRNFWKEKAGNSETPVSV